jgi:hypothetical protein
MYTHPNHAFYDLYWAIATGRPDKFRAAKRALVDFLAQGREPTDPHWSWFRPKYGHILNLNN